MVNNLNSFYFQKNARYEKVNINSEDDGKLYPIHSIAFSDRHVAAASKETQVFRLWTQKLTSPRNFDVGQEFGPIRDLKFSPCGFFIAVAGTCIKVFAVDDETSSAELKAPFDKEDETFVGLAFDIGEEKTTVIGTYAITSHGSLWKFSAPLSVPS
jgi:hypothetical protein